MARIQWRRRRFRRCQ
uniref:Uncharacterized protein n=1 Tax=Arundo donax TaxID=35708 RepID=A0A0A9ART7_ARUDO